MSKGRILCQLKSDTGEILGAPIDLPLDLNKSGLEKICHALLISVKILRHIYRLKNELFLSLFSNRKRMKKSTTRCHTPFLSTTKKSPKP